MKKLNAYIIGLICFLPGLIQGQTATEAFRFSLSDPLGTARNLGVGNSMFAIGPDFSAIASNPSGLGGYMKSEFLITGGLGINHFNSAFASDRNSERTGNYSQASLPNVGFIIYNNPNSGLWNSSNWAIGLNRVADYNRELQFAGNTLGTITDKWRENATGISPDDLNGFEEGLAYTSGAIYDFEEDNIYESDYGTNNQYALFKKENSFIEGGKSEIFIAYGADLNRKLLIGFSVGLPIVNYTELRNYQEHDEPANGVPFFNELEYTSSVNSTGFGWNAKLGVTLKPVHNINIALAIHTPTWLALADNFNTTLSYDYTDENNDGPIKSESPYGSFKYGLKTPWSASAGVGIIAGAKGFLAAHAKLTDYSSMKYNFGVGGNGTSYAEIERQVNADIQSNYGTALQLNMGGELVIDALRFRGGVSMQQSAFTNDHTFDPSLHLGTGYRGDHFYVDLGYKLTKREEGYLPYETLSAPQPLVVTDFTTHQISATLGFKF